MGNRKHEFILNGTYHVYGRTLMPYRVFGKKGFALRFMDLLKYYQYKEAQFPYSIYARMDKEKQVHYLSGLGRNKLTSILAYCLMPNHFHLLLKEVSTPGITSFISKVANSFTKYYNLKNERAGPIFESTFKSNPIKTEEQLLHVSRYIHLNPYTAGLVRTYRGIINYELSSLQEYVKIGEQKFTLCNVEDILEKFDGSSEKYLEYVISYAKKPKAKV